MGKVNYLNCNTLLSDKKIHLKFSPPITMIEMDFVILFRNFAS